MHGSDSRWRRAAGPTLVCAVLLLSGCFGLFHRQDPWQAFEFRILEQSEIAISGPVEDGPVYLTAEPALRLRHAGDAPLAFYFVRPADTREWQPGPIWAPGVKLPEWVPEREGRWELVALSGKSLDQPPSPEGVSPGARVIFDWTPPGVRVESLLPDATVTGGTAITVRWVALDDHLVPERTQLELREREGEPWQPVLALPSGGVATYRVPNRALAGAALRVTAVDRAGNRSSQRVPGSLTVVGVAPQVTLPETRLVAREPRQQIPFALERVTPGPLVRAEVWTTSDAGASWHLAAYDADPEPPFEVELPEGAWGVWLVVHDAEGNRSPYPRPGDAPQAELLVDWTEPLVVWGPIAVRPLAPEPGQTLRLLEIDIPVAIEDPHLDPTSVLAEVLGLDEQWRVVEEPVQVRRALRFPIPESVPEPVHVRLSGADRAGNRFVARHELWPSDVTDPPRIQFLDAPAGWQRGGAEVNLTYEARWQHAAEHGVSLAYSEDGERWVSFAQDLPPIGSWSWQLPEISVPALRLQLTVRSRDGRQRRVVAPTALALDAEPPTARLLGPTQGHGETIQLIYEAADRGGSGLARLQLFARHRLADEWHHVASLDPSAGTVPFVPPAPGAYDLWLVPIDAAGNQGLLPGQVDPRHWLAFEVLAEPPGIQLVNFQDGGVYAGGSGQLVFLSWPEGVSVAGIIDLEVSLDDGGTWQPVARLPLKQTRVHWTLPAIDAERCRLRATAHELTGRRTVDQSRVAFQIDATPPQVMVRSIDETEDGRTRIHYGTRDDGGAGVHQVWVYHSRDEGSTWQRWNEPFAAGEPLELTLEPGPVGLFLCAEDRVGNSAPAPRAGQHPMVRQRVGARGGVQLTLVHPTGGVIGGGTRHYLFWTLESSGAVFSERPVVAEYRVAGEDDWRLIGSALPPSGREPWVAPATEGAVVELRIVATDLNGNQYSATTDEPLLVDSRTPEVFFAGPHTSATRPTVVQARLAHPEDLDRVELWIRAVSTPEWKHVATANVGSSLAADISDGMYRVALVAVDLAGNRSRKPAPGDEGQGILTVDTVPPLLEVEQVGERGRLFHEGEWLVLRPRATDRHLSAFPISFRVSEDGGLTFHEVRRYHANGDEYPLKLPERPGMVLIEVAAEDLAGNRTTERLPVQVVPTPPIVSLLTDPRGAILPARDELRLEWESRGVEPSFRGLSIDFAVDGEQWTRVAQDLPADGHHTWRLPDVDSNRCRLRLVITRPDGLTGEILSGWFTISSTAPRVQVQGVQPRGG